MFQTNRLRLLAMGAALCGLATPAAAQFNVAGKRIDFHGFFQQGFVSSTGNNFLTMNTRSGSFAMTDGGFNMSSRLTPKLRVGAQAFSRNFGDLGNGKVQLDWAFADYRFNDYFGVRGGKVKTVLGLFNDTQDMEFLYAFALLPQSIYPTDLRASTIAHTGGDLYGAIPMKKAGRLSWVAWSGRAPVDKQGGYFLGTREAGYPIDSLSGWLVGGDARWTTPVTGLTAGYSFFRSQSSTDARLTFLPSIGRIPGRGIPFRAFADYDRRQVFFGDYERGKLRLSAEMMQLDSYQRYEGLQFAGDTLASRAWYVMGSYQVAKRLTLGSYYSHYIYNRNRDFSPTNGMRSPVVSARVDLKGAWHVKFEGHFIDGRGGEFSFRNFYPGSNQGGFTRRTNVLIIRTGYNF